MFTLIGYKPDGTCVSMGCEVERYSSDFKFEQCHTRQELAKHICDIRAIQYEEQEPVWQITLMYDGRTIDKYPEKVMAMIEEAVGHELSIRAEELVRQRQKEQADAEQKAAEKKREQEQAELNQFFVTAERLGYSTTKIQTEVQ